MLKIRLQRVGKKNAPSYRVVLAENTAPPQGKFQEILGFYNPRKKEKSFKKERIEHWLSKGAQLSPTVHNLLVDEKILTETKLKAWRPKRKKEKPGEESKESPPAKTAEDKELKEEKIEEKEVKEPEPEKKVEEKEVKEPEPEKKVEEKKEKKVEKKPEEKPKEEPKKEKVKEKKEKKG